MLTLRAFLFQVNKNFGGKVSQLRVNSLLLGNTKKEGVLAGVAGLVNCENLELRFIDS